MMSRPPKVVDRGADEALGEAVVGDAADAGDGLAAGRRDRLRRSRSAGSASRSLTTTRAPSLASFSAISRPMPRPEPETMATLPSSVPMCASFRFECGSVEATSASPRSVAVPSASGHREVEAWRSARRRRRSIAVTTAGAGRPAVDGRDARRTARRSERSRSCGDPVGEQPAEVGHRQHAVREDVVEPGRPRDVEVDVDRVVVAGGAGEQGEGGARDRRDAAAAAARRRRVSVEVMVVMLRLRSGRRTTTCCSASATSSSVLVGDRSLASTRNSSAPPFFS